MNGSGKESGISKLVVDETGINKLSMIEVVNFRVILFDSTNMEKEKQVKETGVSNSKSGLFMQPSYKRSS